MSNRVSYALVVVLLLAAAGLRLWELTSLPPGLHANEILDARIIETARQGRIEVFYDFQGLGREGLYGVVMAALTTMTGSGLLGYRIFSVFVGLLTLSLTYALGKRLFGSPAGAAAMGLLVVAMFPVMLSRSIGREQLLPLIVTAILLALARALPIYGKRPSAEPTTTPFAALGVLLGISFYIHPDALLINLFAMFFIIYMVMTRQPMSRQTFSHLWFALVVLIVVATPYLIASLQLPRLSGANRLFDAGIVDPITNLINAIGGLMFVGDDHAYHNLPGRPMFDLVSAFLIVIGILAILRFWRQPRYFLTMLALIVLAPPAIFAEGSPEFMEFGSLLPVLALCFGLGVTVIFRGLPRRLRYLAAVGVAGLLIFNFQWTIRDMFIRWPALPATQNAFNARVGGISHYLDRTASTTPTVVCTEQLRPSPVPVELAPTQLLALMMTRNDVLLRYADCGSAMVLPNGGERAQIVLIEPEALNGVHPYLQTWLSQGDAVRGDVPLGSVYILDVADLLADSIGAFTTTAPVAFAPEVTGIPDDMVIAPPIRFGGNITFLGDVRNWSGVYRPGDVVQLISYWRVDGRVPNDLRLFTHILPDPVSIAAQSDTFGVLAEQLQTRDVIIQVTFVQLPFTTPDGNYAVSIGAYEDNTGTRLSVFDGDTPRGNRLFLGGLTVERR